MEQILKNIKDISNIKFISSTFNNVSLDLDSGNIYNIDKIRFSNSSIKYLKINFGRYLIIKNMKFYTIENNFLSYRLHYKLPGIPIYQLYHGEDFSKSDSIDTTGINISSIIIEFENKEIIPNIFEYISHKTDEIFNVTHNSVNIKWSWTEDPDKAIRYSTSMPPGVYNIEQFNNELKKLILDVKYGPDYIFKHEYPIEIYGNKVNYPNLTLNLKNTSNNSIIIYKDSAIFKFLTIIPTYDITLSVNNTYEINFEYLPYTNDVTISYSINTIDDNYVTLKKINPFYDIKPITDEIGVEISYNDYNDRKIEIQDTNLIDLNDNTVFKLSLTPDETLGLYTVLGELSSNILTGKYGTHNSLTITDVSSETLNINDISGKTLDISYIDANNLTLTGFYKTSNNVLKSQTVIVSSISCETLDISNGAINIFNNNNYNLNYKNYKFIIFCFKNTYEKPIEFNNFRFSDINSNNPVFSTYLLNKNREYFRLGEISGDELSYDMVENAVNVGNLSDISLNITIPFIEDLSAIIFEFLDPPARGLSFYYNPVDYSNKIFQIDDSNKFIYYTKNDPSFIDISAIIRYTIPDDSYTLLELTELLEKQPNTGENLTVISPDISGVLQTYFIDANTPTPITSSLNIDISNSYKIVDICNNNKCPDDISKISYLSLSGEISNNDISLNSVEINILGEFLDLSYSIIQSYERYYKFENNKPKYLLFINNNLDNSYSIYYGKDLSSSFFEYFFEKDISYIDTSTDISFSNINSIEDDKFETNKPRFSAILTLKDKHNHNQEYDIFSVTTNVSKNGLNISGDFDFDRDTWGTIYTNEVLKTHYVLVDGSGAIDNSHDTIHYSVSFDEAFLKIDNSNLIYNKLDKIGPTDNSSSIESKKKYIYMYQDLSIVELSCNDISYETREINTNDYYLNNVDISNVSNVVSITTHVLDTHSNSISFQNTGSNLKLAYFSSDLSHSGTRMDIYSPLDASGWCIEMIPYKNQYLSGYGKLEFTKQEFTKKITPRMQKTILNINCGIVLTNENLTNLSDDRFIDASNSLSTFYTGVINNPVMFNGTDTFNPDISYSYAIMDVILKLFPIKYTKLNSRDHLKFGSVIDNGYDLYDVSNIIPQLKYILKDDNIKGITYSSLTPYLCKAIQELSATILHLETSLNIV